MVTVTYEQARGLRQKHEKPGGYEISVSRTVNAPLASVYKKVANEKSRSLWLSEDAVTIKKSSNKSMRMAWKDGKTAFKFLSWKKATERVRLWSNTANCQIESRRKDEELLGESSRSFASC